LVAVTSTKFSPPVEAAVPPWIALIWKQRPAGMVIALSSAFAQLFTAAVIVHRAVSVYAAPRSRHVSVAEGAASDTESEIA
jgi:hypothetical protein